MKMYARIIFISDCPIKMQTIRTVTIMNAKTSKKDWKKSYLRKGYDSMVIKDSLHCLKQTIFILSIMP